MSFVNEALVSAVRNRLMSDSRIAALSIDITCSDGYVCLVGCVDREEQKAVALELVTGMIGVRRVKDELRVRCPAAPAMSGSSDFIQA